jgi:anaerobic magnesium-protoporphyrin IX monomethyl ester cyclase
VLLAHSYFLFHDAKQVRKMRPYPPLGTLIGASILREKAFDVRVFDAMLAHGLEEFRMLLAEHQPAIVGIFEDGFNFLTKMCTLRMREDALAMIRIAKETGARVALNGPDATDHPEMYFEAGADAILTGEIEETAAELFDAWERDGEAADLEGIRGLIRWIGNEAVRTAPRMFVEDLDSLPFPAWDLVDTDRYREVWSGAHGRLSLNMNTTRGCPFRCNWCAKPLYGTRYKQRSPENVAAEMRELKRQAGPGHIWFADDIFGLSPNWIESFATAVEAADCRIPFTIQSRVDLMTESAVAALAHAGAEEVWMGVESGSQKILDAMDKGTTIEQVRLATRRLKKHGIRAAWFLQLGYTGEDWEEILLTRELVRKEQPDDVGVSVSYPLPGTLFYERVQQQLGEQQNWEDSDDLAMMFAGAFQGPFYRLVRDLLHLEAETKGRQQLGLDHRWQELAKRQDFFRAKRPVSLPPALSSGPSALKSLPSL